MPSTSVAEICHCSDPPGNIENRLRDCLHHLSSSALFCRPPSAYQGAVSIRKTKNCLGEQMLLCLQCQTQLDPSLWAVLPRNAGGERKRGLAPPNSSHSEVFIPSNWTVPSEREAHAQLARGRQMPWVRLRRHDHMNVSLQPEEQLCLPLWHFLPACLLSKEMHCGTRQMTSFWFWLTASLEADSANILKWSEPMVKLYQPLCVTRVSISEKAGKLEYKTNFPPCKNPCL